MARGIKRHIAAARKRVCDEIISTTNRGGLYSGRLTSKDYADGYLAALDDVSLVLNGVRPNMRNYWQDMGGE